MSAPLRTTAAATNDAGTTSPTGPGSSETETPAPSAPEAVVADRRCGRCQRPFPGDPALNFQTDWALCPDCAPILMPRPAGSPS